MIATYQGGGAEALLSVGVVLQSEQDATSRAVGSAQRAGVAALVAPTRHVVEEVPEDEITKLERKAHMLGRVLEYGVSSSFLCVHRWRNRFGKA